MYIIIIKLRVSSLSPLSLTAVIILASRISDRWRTQTSSEGTFRRWVGKGLQCELV